WGLTILRPTVIYGDAPGSNLNPILAFGVYAALQKAKDEPLYFPGAPGIQGLREGVDAALVGRALAWAAEAPTARGEAFNITNGDVFIWKHAWPAVADAF